MQCLGLGSSMIGMLVIDEMMTGSGVMDGTMVIHQVAMQQWTSSNGPILGIKMMVSGSGVDLLPGRIARIGDKMESGRSEHGVGVTGTLVVDGLTMASGMSAENSTHGATVRLERQMPVNLHLAEVNVEIKLVQWKSQLQAPAIQKENPGKPGSRKQGRK